MRINAPASVELVLDDRRTDPVPAKVTVMLGEREIIVSDNLASKLGIVILDPFEGIWCLRDEIGVKRRKGLPRPEEPKE
ncbi:MAG: hypothetical protein ACTSXX_11875 [Candidatus Baldrarchaeia archaeon]